MNNPGIFQDLLNLFHAALAPGLAAIRPKILGLFTFLLFLETARVASGPLQHPASPHATRCCRPCPTVRGI